MGLGFYVGIGQGTQNNQRVGNKIHAKRYGVNLWFNFSITIASATQASCRLRALLLYPRKGVDSASINAYLTNSVPGIYNRPDPNIFYVLMDRTWTMGSASATYGAGNNPSTYRLKFSRKARYILNYDSNGES